jgi:hypothetical protein
MTIVLGRAPISVNDLRAVYQTTNATHLHLAVNRFHQRPDARPARGRRDRGTVVNHLDAGRGRPTSARPGRAGPVHSPPTILNPRVVRVGGDRRVITAVRPASSASRADGIDDVVRRVTRRSQRIEISDTSRRVTRARVDVMADVARVLAAPESPTTTDAPARVSGSLRAPAPAAPSQFDIESLTDQIVTRLDDRLTAHRERFGRAF